MTAIDHKRRIVFADECEPCPQCGEPVCPVCKDHYADCPCPGPHSDPEEEFDELDLTDTASPPE